MRRETKVARCPVLGACVHVSLRVWRRATATVRPHRPGIFLAVIGVVWTLKMVSNVLKFVFTTFLRPGKNIKKLGSWAVRACMVCSAHGMRNGAAQHVCSRARTHTHTHAQVVTGATDGIGLALAKEIAKKGVNVVLVSRSMDKLKVVARAHTHEQPRTTRVCTLKDTGRRACLPGGRSEEH